MSDSDEKIQRKPDKPLKKGWTTGACATAAAKAAYIGLLTGKIPTEITIRLPRGELPTFKVLNSKITENTAEATIQKDAGDDPDITHGALISSHIKRDFKASPIIFKAGKGVGMVTLPGLPILPGEAAINPKPREMITYNLQDIADQQDQTLQVEVTVSVEGGEELALKTWNPRLGIKGGISILGTTGIVVPFSCSAWIHSIHRGIDVARANGFTHVAASTGNQSENAVRDLFKMKDEALLDMGDFAGGLLKYMRKNPVERLTISGGFAKLLKLAQGEKDLHSSRSQVNFSAFGTLVKKIGGTPEQIELTKNANTAKQVLDSCPNLPLAETIARQAREVALATLAGETKVDILVVDRNGKILSHVGQEG